MAENVTITNDYDYLFIQAMGWDYNFWTVLFVDIGTVVLLLGISFTILFIVKVKYD